MNENISVIIANYNNGGYLRECLDSVINQTTANWDIIILDDASTDNSKEVYKEYENNKNITIHFNKKNLGYTASLKRLIELSENDIIGILDPDDKLAPTCLGKIADYYYKHCKAGFVYTNFWYCDEHMKIQKLGYSKPMPPGENNLDLNCVSAFRTFRKSFYNKTEGLDENLLYADDKDLILKMEEVTHLYMINEPLYYYRVLSSSQSHGEKRKTSKKNYDIAKNNARKRRGLEDPKKLSMKLKNINYKFWKKKKKKKKIPTLADYKNVALENLINAKNILNDLNMSHWLTDGTLLGYYRNKDFIPHDSDVDIGSFIEDYNDEVIMRFLDNGWTCEHIFGRKDIGLELSFRRNHIKLDIFFFYEESDKYWHGAWLKTDRGLNLIKYYYDKFSIKEIEFLEYKFNVPDNPLKYIETKYGKTWNVTVKKWDWAFEPANAKKTVIYY